MVTKIHTQQMSGVLSEALKYYKTMQGKLNNPMQQLNFTVNTDVNKHFSNTETLADERMPSMQAVEILGFASGTKPYHNKKVFTSENKKPALDFKAKTRIIANVLI